MAQSSVNDLFSRDFTAAEFKERRTRVAGEIGSSASALLQGAPRPATPHPEFAQSKVFYYLCGIQIERSYLLIDGKDGETTLFVPAEGLCNVKGGALDETMKKALCDLTGIDRVLCIENLEEALSSVKTLYLLQRPDEEPFATKFGLMGKARLRAEDPFDGAKRRDELLTEVIQAKCPGIEIAELDPILGKMRLIKSPSEIEVLRKTGRMSARVCIESMKATQPGIPTGVYNGIADYVFRVTGGCGHAYDFILEPSHPESDVMLDGDLVLVDCAPDYHGYAMDIARIWPVNGTFDAWQRHTYGLIVNYHKILLEMAKPGAMVQEVYDEAARRMLEMYKGDEAASAILDNMITRGVRYYNHHVGMSAHDAIDQTWRERPLEPGQVMVVDPMVWLTDAPHGYVRVEDTIVITESGCEVLTGSVPYEVEAIEALMKEPTGFPLDLKL